MEKQLKILATSIRQDDAGRYCLNDCHRASGGDAGTRPGEWLRNDQAKALVAELTDAENPASPVSSVKGGLNQGTYVAKELVYAYAMWISPKFHLQVIRAFDGIMTAPSAPKIPQTMAEALRLAADQAEQIEAQQKQIAISQPKADALDLLSKAHGDLGVQDAGRVLEVGQHWIVNYVMIHGWACRRSKKLRPAYYGLEMGYCRLFTRTYYHRITGEEMATDDFVLTRKGITRLGEIIAKMKAAAE